MPQVNATTSPPVEVVASAFKPARLVSLDVFRGATVAAMMLVNNPGDWNAVYAPLEHAEWNGWTFTDLVFPFFLWIVGMAVPLSTTRRVQQGQTHEQLLSHALRRAVIIFALGFSLNAFNYFIDGSLLRDGLGAWWHDLATHVRIPGVLQRIAVCYLIATAVYLLAGVRGVVTAMLTLLAGYWLLMVLVPVPGCGAGSLTKECNFSQYVDNLVLNGPHVGTHVYKGTKTWDPEGLVSTLPAIATCLFGILAGTWLPRAKTIQMFVAGGLLVVLGQILSHWLPINKSLWTSSYSVFMAGMAMICFAACHWLVDIQKWSYGTKPLAIYGMNAITMFMLAGISGRLLLEIKVAGGSGGPVALKTFLYDHLFGWFSSPDTAGALGFLASPKNASLVWAILYVLGLYLVAYAMYRKKWFIRF